MNGMVGRRAAAGFVVAGVLAGAAAFRAAAQTGGEGAAVALSLPSQPPAGAVVLLAGKASAGDVSGNWYRRYTTNAANWGVDGDGAATPEKAAKSDLTSRREFGDCFLHAEFRCPTTGHGNSGIGFQGRYEVQILGDHGQKPSAGGAGGFYSQKAPMTNASKKAGEWQAYDIVFRAPRLDDAGKVVEKARATVFLNGVLVQNNEEFNGPTGIQYSQYKDVTKTGPIVLQGDHDPVSFRNVWVVPM